MVLGRLQHRDADLAIAVVRPKDSRGRGDRRSAAHGVQLVLHGVAALSHEREYGARQLDLRAVVGVHAAVEHEVALGVVACVREAHGAYELQAARMACDAGLKVLVLLVDLPYLLRHGRRLLLRRRLEHVVQIRRYRLCAGPHVLGRREEPQLGERLWNRASGVQIGLQGRPDAFEDGSQIHLGHPAILQTLREDPDGSMQRRLGAGSDSCRRKEAHQTALIGGDDPLRGASAIAVLKGVAQTLDGGTEIRRAPDTQATDEAGVLLLAADPRLLLAEHNRHLCQRLEAPILLPPQGRRRRLRKPRLRQRVFRTAEEGVVDVRELGKRATGVGVVPRRRCRGPGRQRVARRGGALSCGSGGRRIPGQRLSAPLAKLDGPSLQLGCFVVEAFPAAQIPSQAHRPARRAAERLWLGQTAHAEAEAVALGERHEVQRLQRPRYAARGSGPLTPDDNLVRSALPPQASEGFQGVANIQLATRGCGAVDGVERGLQAVHDVVAQEALEAPQVVFDVQGSVQRRLLSAAPAMIPQVQREGFHVVPAVLAALRSTVHLLAVQELLLGVALQEETLLRQHKRSAPERQLLRTSDASVLVGDSPAARDGVSLAKHGVHIVRGHPVVVSDARITGLVDEAQRFLVDAALLAVPIVRYADNVGAVAVDVDDDAVSFEFAAAAAPVHAVASLEHRPVLLRLVPPLGAAKVVGVQVPLDVAVVELNVKGAVAMLAVDSCGTPVSAAVQRFDGVALSEVCSFRTVRDSDHLVVDASLFPPVVVLDVKGAVAIGAGDARRMILSASPVSSFNFGPPP
eukprot:scaffold1817_cov250-Pinguiococcus_pyrenoidosus.AAC.2